MCGKFTMLTYDEVLGVIRSIEFSAPFNSAPEWPARGVDALPGSMVPLIFPGEGGRLKVAELSWGYPASWQKGVVFNTRIESALSGGGMWSESIQQRRCVVPTRGFYEPHHSETFRNPQTGRTCKQQYRFTMPGSPLLLLAGVYEGGHFSVVTTEPNASVSSVHDRMPLVLGQQEVLHWLGNDYARLADRGGISLSAERVFPSPTQDEANNQLSLF